MKKTNVLQIIEIDGQIDELEEIIAPGGVIINPGPLADPFRPKAVNTDTVTSINFDSVRVAVHSERHGNPRCIRKYTQLTEHRGGSC
jgi:hypothetical protein